MQASTFKQIFILLVSALIASCAPKPGPTIDTPTIPVAKTNAEIRGRLGSYVTVQSVTDERRALTENEAVRFTEPQGNVPQNVETALSDSLRERGISVVDTAPVKIRAEIRSWRSEVTMATTPTLMSEASLYVEVYDAFGKRLYSGTYQGTRQSQFPVVTREDMKDSLAYAMSSAIEQAIGDEQLLNHIGGY